MASDKLNKILEAEAIDSQAVESAQRKAEEIISTATENASRNLENAEKETRIKAAEMIAEAEKAAEALVQDAIKTEQNKIALLKEKAALRRGAAIEKVISSLV